MTDSTAMVEAALSGGRRNALAGLFLCEAFEQLDVVAIVAGDGFEDELQGEIAALRVGGGAGEVFGSDGGEQADVPGADGLVGGLGGGEVVGGVAVAPAILIEGLERGCVGGEGLAEAPAPDDLGVGEMRHQLPEAPLVLAGGVVDLLGGVRGEELAEAGRGGADDVDGVVAFEVVGVRILFHGTTVARDDGAPALLCGRWMIRVPEGLIGRDVINAHAGKEGAEILRGLLHAGFFGDFVTDQDEGFRSSFGDGVADVLDGLPLAGLAGDEHISVVRVESEDMLCEASGTGSDGDVGDGEVGPAFKAEGLDVEFGLEELCELLEGGGRDGDEVLAEGAGGMREGLPAERGVEAVEDVVVVGVGVDGVVQAIDDEVVLLDEVTLALVDGIVLELGDVVAMVIEGGLVGDDEVVAATDGLAEDVKGVEEGGGDAGDGGGGIAGLEGVDGVCGRGGGVMGVDAGPGVAGGEGRLCREPGLRRTNEGGAE